MARHGTTTQRELTETPKFTRNGLSKDTVRELWKKGYRCSADFSSMSNATIKDLEIPTTQKNRLRNVFQDIMITKQRREEKNARALEVQAVPEVPEDTEETRDKSEKKRKQILRPHELIYHRDTDFLEFLYANLLSLDKMTEQDHEGKVPFLRHLRYMSLKMMQEFTLENVLMYDKDVRDTLEREHQWWEDSNGLKLGSKYFRADQLATWKSMRSLSSRDNARSFSTDRCLSWNYAKGDSGCPAGDNCKYRHVCIMCAADHSYINCPVFNLKKHRTTTKEGSTPRRKISR